MIFSYAVGSECGGNKVGEADEIGYTKLLGAQRHHAVGEDGAVAAHHRSYGVA